MSFIEELKQRKVARVAMVYPVLAWVAIQVLSTVLPAFDAPAWALRTSILVAALGYPLALVFAWLLELTPEGLRLAAGRAGTRRMLGISALLVALPLAWYFVDAPRTRGGIPPAALANDRSIAVLPFANLTGKASNDAFVQGMADSLQEQLSQIPGLTVIARASTRALDPAMDAGEAGRRLGAGHLLQGSVQQAGKMLRISVRLVDTGNGAQAWTKHYDRAFQDVFEVQDEVAGAVVAALKDTLSPDDAAALHRRGRADAGAYREFLEGRALFADDRVDSLRRALAHFERAMRIDPAYAPAYVAAYRATVFLWGKGAVPTSDMLQARARYLPRALQLAPDYFDAHVALAQTLKGAHDLDGAEREFKRAIELAPASADTYMYYGDVLLFSLGRPQEALAMATRATVLDPLSVKARLLHAIALLSVGQADAAASELRRILAAHPDDPDTQEWLARALSRKRDLVGALQVTRHVADLDPEAVADRDAACWVLLDFDAVDEGRRCLEGAIAADPDPGRSQVLRGYLAEAEGNFPLALSLLQDAASTDPLEAARLLLMNGRYEEALAAIRASAPEFLDPAKQPRRNFPQYRGLAGIALLHTGDPERGRDLLRAMLRDLKDLPVSGTPGRSWDEALAHAQLGDNARACEALRSAVGDGYASWIATDLDQNPLFADLRGDPCYAAALKPARAKNAAQVAAARAAGLL